MNITIGKIVAINRPADVAVSVSSALARAKRAVSYGSRTNARTTRMPVICSRRIRLTLSIRVCISRNNGPIFRITRRSRTRALASPLRPARTARHRYAAP